MDPEVTNFILFVTTEYYSKPYLQFFFSMKNQFGILQISPSTCFPLEHIGSTWLHSNPWDKNKKLDAVNFHALWLVGPPPSPRATAVHMFQGRGSRGDMQCGPADATTADLDSWDATGCQELADFNVLFRAKAWTSVSIRSQLNYRKPFQIAVTESLVEGAGHMLLSLEKVNIRARGPNRWRWACCSKCSSVGLIVAGVLVIC